MQEVVCHARSLAEGIDIEQNPTTVTARLEIDDKSVTICNEQSSWSIDRRTYDVQRTVLVNESKTGEESFDRERDAIISPAIQQTQQPNIAGFDAKKTLVLSLGALGVVYGDIGTSPLYTVQTMYASVSIDRDNLIGGISTLIWLINLVVTFKYVIIVLRANNHGEGGVMALTALANQTEHYTTSSWRKAAITFLGKCLF
jgi:hypothetical protein